MMEPLNATEAMRTARLLQGQVVQVAVVALCILVCGRHNPEDALLAKWLPPRVADNPVPMLRADQSTDSEMQYSVEQCLITRATSEHVKAYICSTYQYSMPFSLPQPITDTMWLIVGYSFRCMKMPTAQQHHTPSAHVMGRCRRHHYEGVL